MFDSPSDVFSPVFNADIGGWDISAAILIDMSSGWGSSTRTSQGGWNQ